MHFEYFDFLGIFMYLQHDVFLNLLIVFHDNLPSFEFLSLKSKFIYFCWQFDFQGFFFMQKFLGMLYVVSLFQQYDQYLLKMQLIAHSQISFQPSKLNHLIVDVIFHILNSFLLIQFHNLFSSTLFLITQTPNDLLIIEVIILIFHFQKQEDSIDFIIVFVKHPNQIHKVQLF